MNTIEKYFICNECGNADSSVRYSGTCNKCDVRAISRLLAVIERSKKPYTLHGDMDGTFELRFSGKAVVKSGINDSLNRFCEKCEYTIVKK